MPFEQNANFAIQEDALESVVCDMAATNLHKVETVCIFHGMYNRYVTRWCKALQWCHNGHDGISNHQPQHCLLIRWFRRRSKKTSNLQVADLCTGNSPVTGEFPAQKASNADNVSIWWRHEWEKDGEGIQNLHPFPEFQFSDTFHEAASLQEFTKSVPPPPIELSRRS